MFVMFFCLFVNVSQQVFSERAKNQRSLPSKTATAIFYHAARDPVVQRCESPSLLAWHINSSWTYSRSFLPFIVSRIRTSSISIALLANKRLSQSAFPFRCPSLLISQALSWKGEISKQTVNLEIFTPNNKLSLLVPWASFPSLSQEATLSAGPCNADSPIKALGSGLVW